MRGREREKERDTERGREGDGWSTKESEEVGKEGGIIYAPFMFRSTVPLTQNTMRHLTINFTNTRPRRADPHSRFKLSQTQQYVN